MNTNFKKFGFLTVLAVSVVSTGCNKGSGGPGGGPVTPPALPPAAQVKCYNATPTTLTRKNAAMLCSSSEGAGTVSNCYDQTNTDITDGQASLVCAGSPDRKPVDCIYDPAIGALDNFNAAVLCSYTANNNPISCYNNSSLSLFDDEAAVLCQGATSPDGPNQCYLDTPLTLAERDAATLCSQVSTGYAAAPLDCYDLSPLELSNSEAAILCQKSTNADATLSCYQNSPSYLTNYEAAVLCSGSKTGGSNSYPALCMDNSSTDLTNLEAAYMCSGSGADYAAQGANVTAANYCFKTTSPNLPEPDAAVLCSQNTGLLTSMYSINTQYQLRQSNPRGQPRNGAYSLRGNVDEIDTLFVKRGIVMKDKSRNYKAERGKVGSLRSNNAGLNIRKNSATLARTAATKRRNASLATVRVRPSGADLRTSSEVRLSKANHTINQIVRKPKENQ